MIERMGKRRRRSSRDSFWTQQYGGMPVWGLTAAVVSLLIAAAVAVPAALSQPQRTEAREPRPLPTMSAPEQNPVAAFIGDSYTQGAGAEPLSARWSTLVSRELSLAEENFGRGGTGFVTTSGREGCGLDYCPTYVEMVPDVIESSPDVVFIAGGQNDFSAFSDDPDVVAAAVAEVYEGVREALPDATIVAVGPSTPGEIGATVSAFDKMIRDAAASVDATYVSLIDPDVLTSEMLLSDGQHVDNTGHRAISDRILAAQAVSAISG